MIIMLGFLFMSSCNKKTINYPVPEVQFIHSSLGDYLHYLFERPNANPELNMLFSTNLIPELGARIALPEIVTSLQITKYDDIYPIVDTYYSGKYNAEKVKPFSKKLTYSYNKPSSNEIKKLLRLGAKKYPEFEKIWITKLSEYETKQIEEWRQQLYRYELLQKLASFTKLPFRSKKIQIAAMIFHHDQSINYSPSSIYSGLLKKPDIVSLIGHQGTHLLLSRGEHDWTDYPGASAVIKLAASKGVKAEDIEEVMCVYVRSKLLLQCGLDSSYEQIAFEEYEEGFYKSMLLSLKENEKEYLLSKKNGIDFMLRCAKKVLIGD